MTPQNIKKILKSDFPDLQIKTIKKISEGWRNYVFLVNNSLIVRFPKQINPFIKIQKQVLQKLSPKISYKLPTIHYINPTYCYSIYPAILACSYTKFDFVNFTNTEKQRISYDLANFLNQLHSAINLKELMDIGVPTFDYQKEIEDIKTETKKFLKLNLDAQLKAFVESQAKIAVQHLSLSQKYLPVLLHNDLHIKNIILECETKNLNGVIDFDDIKIGHYHLDFANLAFSLPFDIFLSITQQYTKLTGRDVYLDYVFAIATDYVASNLVKYPNNTKLWEESIETLKEMNKILCLNT